MGVTVSSIYLTVKSAMFNSAFNIHSIWSLHVLTLSLWVSSLSSSFFPQSKKKHAARLIEDCVKGACMCICPAIDMSRVFLYTFHPLKPWDRRPLTRFIPVVNGLACSRRSASTSWQYFDNWATIEPFVMFCLIWKIRSVGCYSTSQPCWKG